MAIRKAYFDVHPSVVFKLGEDLITDEIQALAELVKNSYDADATRVIVRIDTTVAMPLGGSGKIEISDDGFGMSPDDIQRGWLTISNSSKRQMKAEGRTTARGRTPLGDKGLGRLGAQRLGDRVEIRTSVGDGVTHRMEFSWLDFANRESLHDVPVSISSTADASAKAGTVLTISGLHDPEIFAATDRLTTELGRTISPYSEISAFRLYLTVNGESIDLGTVDRRVRDASTTRYTVYFDGKSLHVRGFVRLAQLRPNTKEEREIWHRVAESDGGHGLLAFLQSKKSSSRWQIKPARSKKWWLEMTHSIDLAAVHPRLAADGSPANPGPFKGEIDSFNMAVGSVEEVGVFSRASELRKLLKSMHGIRIYRDGFNVRASDDWLGLGRQITSGGSWYGLRPATTMGYVAISAAENGQLRETTDREGFIRTPAYETFENLLHEFILMTSQLQEFIGRGAVEYRRLFDLDDEVKANDVETVVSDLKRTLKEAESYVGPLRAVSAELARSAAAADSAMLRLRRDVPPSQVDPELLEAILHLSQQAEKAGRFVDSLEGYMTQVATQEASASRLKADLDMLSDQLTLTYETMAVGLTAESLAHEIGNIAERLARRSTEIRRYIRQKHPNEVRLTNYVEQVQGTVAGLRRQLAHLAPSLRYVRERREDLQVSAIIEDIAGYYRERWGENIAVECEVQDDFWVAMNRGKLIQVFDNLILNSEYWLLEEVRMGGLSRPRIKVVVASPVVTLEDNGPGVDPQVEHALFEPFISSKPRGRGRGLGLFISRQLLDAEGCEVSLDPRRNANGRKYRFDVDLRGAVVDD